MNTMNREFNYAGYRINVKVELRVRAEKHPGGKVWHKITINDMGSCNYYQTREVEDSNLVIAIDEMETAAKLWINTRESEMNLVGDKRLASLGFK